MKAREEQQLALSELVALATPPSCATSIDIIDSTRTGQTFRKAVEFFAKLNPTQQNHPWYLPKLIEFSSAFPADDMSMKAFRIASRTLIGNLLSEGWSRVCNELSLSSTIRNRRSTFESGIRYHDDFETILLGASPTYRDHFEHTFWVLLFGSLCLSADYDNMCKQYRRAVGVPDKNASELLDTGWLLTAVLHDSCYPFQEMEEWLPKFLVHYLPGAEHDNLFAFHQGRLVFDPRYQSYIEQIAGLGTHLASANARSSWHPYSTRTSSPEIRSIIYNTLKMSAIGGEERASPQERAAATKIHSVLGSLSVLARLEMTPRNRASVQTQTMSAMLYSAALAILMHHLNSKQLRQIALGGSSKQLSSSRFTLSRLLLFVDTAQEFLRGRKERKIKRQGNADVTLKALSLMHKGAKKEIAFELEWPKYDAAKAQELEKGYAIDNNLSYTIWACEKGVQKHRLDL